MTRLRRIILPLAAAALLVLAVVSTGGARPGLGNPPTVPTGPGPVILPATAVRATNTLALELLPRLGGQGNVVFSPYSIEAALAMVDQGAAGSTASEIAHVLGGEDASALAGPNLALANALISSVSPPAGTKASDVAHLLIANGLWVQDGLALENPFTTTLGNDFGAAPQSADFHGDAAGARQAINGWIAAHTGQLIKNLMGPAAITPRTALVLANAIYLKAHWASPFEKTMTAPAPFTTAAGGSVRAPFMTQSPTEFGYGHGKGYVAVDLPYLNSRLSMLAVMPAPGTIATFQRSLTAARFGRVVGSLRRQFVDLRMPKLSLKLHTDLSAALARLGMPTAFSDQADFSGITRATSLKIATVQHGALLRIDEAGTVAAAATGISLEPTAVPIGPAARVTLNHPYLLFLRDDGTGAILFAARVADPTQG
jgi:serpin B